MIKNIKTDFAAAAAGALTVWSIAPIFGIALAVPAGVAISAISSRIFANFYK